MGEFKLGLIKIAQLYFMGPVVKIHKKMEGKWSEAMGERRDVGRFYVFLGGTWKERFGVPRRKKGLGSSVGKKGEVVQAIGAEVAI